MKGGDRVVMAETATKWEIENGVRIKITYPAASKETCIKREFTAAPCGSQEEAYEWENPALEDFLSSFKLRSK